MLFIKLFENGELRKNGKAKFSILIGGMEVYKGIVLSAAQTDAFLAIANDEKLICEKGCSDGIYQKRTARLPDLFRANEVLEQFVVAGKIYVDPVTYRYLDGQLIEKGIILPYEKTSNELDFLSYDIFTVQRMLFEQGYSPSEYTEERIFELFYELNKGIREYLALTDGFDSAFAEIEIREALGLYNFVSLEEQRRFDHCRKLKTEIYTNPVYSVLSEYRDILNIAYHNNLLCPFSAVSNSTTKVPPIESDNAVMILKYTSETLGRISTARTLKENVRLVQSKEAKAYHEKINEWLSVLAAQGDAGIHAIETDIKNAQRAMHRKKYAETIGKFVAVIGATSTAASWSYPAIATVASVMTFAGLGTTFFNPTKKYLWASFGLQGSTT